jgi:hypothetical protein
MLLGVAGPKNSGKDTFVARLGLYVPNVIVRAFAEPLKRACQQLFLLSEEQLYDTEAKEKLDPRWNLSPRQMFQQVGTDYVRRQVNPDFWLKHFELWYQTHGIGKNVFVSDVRFQNEVDLIHRLGGKVVYIYRPFAAGGDFHESETSAQELQNIDYTIDNCGSIHRFYQEIDSFAEKL